MAPAWYQPHEVPLTTRMWADDKFWYPYFLAGKSFHGVFHFWDTHTLVSHCLEEAESLVLPCEPL